MLENCPSFYRDNSTLINFLYKNSIFNRLIYYQMRSILSMFIFFSQLLYTEYLLTIRTSNFAKKTLPLPPFLNTDLVRRWITCKTRYSFNIWETSIFCWQKRKLVQHTRNKQEQFNLQDEMTTSSEKRDVTRL